MATLRKEDEKHEKIIRALLKQPGNRVCINCGSLGPQYVCTNFSTFICTLCSGIHREFLHRIKSVSMAKFTATEINDLQSGGNDQARRFFFKTWNTNRDLLPDSRNPDKIREFIKVVYIQRRFTGEKESSVVHQHVKNYPQAGGNISALKSVPVKRENGDLDRTSMDDGTDESLPKSPPNQKTASGSKRETVIRQLLQPPVEKRKNQQLQRNYSSGNISSGNVSSEQAPRRVQVQRSNSLSLKDLMTEEKNSPNSQSVSKSKSLVDLTEHPAHQTQAPSSRKPSVTTKSSSTPCLIDLISGDAIAADTVTGSTKPQHGNVYHGNDLIDFSFEDQSSVANSNANSAAVDPFVGDQKDQASKLHTRNDQVGGQVPHAITDFTSYIPGLHIDHQQSISSAHGGDFVPPPGLPHAAGPGPGGLPSYNADISPVFTAASAVLPPTLFDYQAPLKNNGVGMINASGPPSAHPMNMNFGYSQMPTRGNPFDMSPLSRNLYAMPPMQPTQTLPANYYYHQQQGVYNQGTMQVSPVHYPPPPPPPSSLPGNPFA